MKTATAQIKALDLFAGTGWGVACKRLGIKEAGVEIMREAVETRTANGMETIYRDVWDGAQLTAEQHRFLYGSYGLLIASPPCQTFSLAGKGSGRAALDEVLEAIELHASVGFAKADIGDHIALRGAKEDGEFLRITIDQAAMIQSYPPGRGLCDRPSPTITGGGTEAGGAEPIAKFHERYTSAPGWVGSTERLSIDEAAALQTYPTSAAKNMGAGMVERYGSRPDRSTTEPSFTIRASAGGMEPGGFVWKHGDESTRKQTPGEASALQTYEPPFVWCGTKTKQFLQIGNAVPPLLAEAILAALIGIRPGR